MCPIDVVKVSAFKYHSNARLYILVQSIPTSKKRKRRNHQPQDRQKKNVIQIGWELRVGNARYSLDLKDHVGSKQNFQFQKELMVGQPKKKQMAMKALESKCKLNYLLIFVRMQNCKLGLGFYLLLCILRERTKIIKYSNFVFFLIKT